MSVTISSRACAASPRKRRALSRVGASVACASTSVMPSMLLSGVRMSWLMFAKKALLACAAASASMRRRFRLKVTPPTAAAPASAVNI